MLKKFFAFISIGIFCLILAIISLYLLFSYNTGLVLLYTPYMILAVSFIGVLIWSVWYKDLFEKILIYVTYTCSLFAFVILIPLAVERSLSSFIYFYTVEQGYFDKRFVSNEYMSDFLDKRLIDGVKGKFLRQEGDLYYPTFKTKVFYNILNPFGILTGTLKNYEVFKDEIQQGQNNNNEGEFE